MLIDSYWIYSNKLQLSIFLFIILFIIFHIMKPNIVYLSDGSFREFGLGYFNKTIIPIWLIVIGLGIFSYVTILYISQNI